MSDNTVVLYRSKDNQPEAVDVSKAKAALASGDYYSGSASKTRESGVAHSVDESGARAQAGVDFESGSQAGEAQRAEAHTESFNNLDDKMQAFLSGGIDALSLGFIKAHSDIDKENIEQNSKYAFGGELFGTAVQLGLTGGAGEAAEAVRGGEAAGKAAIKGIADQASTKFLTNVGARAINDAAVGGAMGAAHAIGSGISDSIVENKPMTVEAFSEEAGIGALLGFAGGGIGGALEGGTRGVTQGAVRMQGGLLDASSRESEALVGLINHAHGELDGALEHYSQRVGGMQELADQGVYPQELVDFRVESLKRARKAQAELDKFDANVVNDPKSPKYEAWRKASDDYHAAVKDLAEVTHRPGLLDQIAAGNQKVQDLTPMSEGEFQAQQAEGLKIQDNIRKRDSDPGTPGMGVIPQIQAHMTPELEAQYGALHGQDFQDPRSGFTQMGMGGESKPVSGMKMDEANLGGEITPTSNDRTNIGKVKSQPEPIPPRSGGTEQLSVDPYQTNPGNLQAPVDDAAANAQKFVAVKDSVFNAPEPAKTVRGSDAEINAAIDRDAPKAKTEAKSSDAEGKAKLKEFIDRWYEESKKSGPRMSAMDEAEMRIHNMLFDLNDKNGGKLDTVAGTFDWRNAGSSLTQRVDQVRHLREMAAMAADEARGVKTPLRELAGESINKTSFREGVAAAAKLGGGLAAEKVVKDHFGNEAATLLGVALVGKYSGMAGKLASSAGKVAGKIREAAAGLLKGSRSTALSVAATRNVAYQYTPDGPEKDPIKRIQQIQELSQRPDEIQANAMKSMGDLAIMHPEIADGLAKQAVNRIQTIAMMAPAIYFDNLGRTMQPNAESMRKFLECENAAHNPSQVLDSIRAGNCSATQLQSFKISAPAIYMGVVQELMKDPEKIKTLSPARLKLYERIMDQPLQHSSEPDAMARSQMAWSAIGMQQDQQSANSISPQAFKMAPTPGQAQTKAPGN